MNIPVLIDMSSVDVNKPLESMADRLSASGQTLVVGMLAVFAVLAILWIVLAFMGGFFTGAPNASEEEKAPSIPVSPAAPAPAASCENDEEIAAAITAAISVMLDKPQSAFRVVSFRQTSREAFRRKNKN